jgi:hypothetical protein
VGSSRLSGVVIINLPDIRDGQSPRRALQSLTPSRSSSCEILRLVDDFERFAPGRPKRTFSLEDLGERLQFVEVDDRHCPTHKAPSAIFIGLFGKIVSVISPIVSDKSKPPAAERI